MSDLGWRADGIARALAAGGVELERYRRPGFIGGTGVRPVPTTGGSGFDVDAECADPGPWDDRRPIGRPESR